MIKNLNARKRKVTYIVLVLVFTAMSQTGGARAEEAKAMDAPSVDAPEQKKPEEAPKVEQAPSTQVLAEPSPTVSPEPPKAEAKVPEPVKKPTFGPSVSFKVPHPVWLELHHRTFKYLGFSIGGGGITFTEKLINQVLTQKLHQDKLPVDSLRGTVVAGDAKLRLHPFGGSFFLGSGFGYQSMSLNVKKTSAFKQSISLASQIPDGVPAEILAQLPIVQNTVTIDGKLESAVEASIKTIYASPQLGWLWVFDSGFLMGMDFGVQLPLNSTTKSTITTKVSSENAAVQEFGQIAIDTLPEVEKERTKVTDEINDGLKKVAKLPLPSWTILRVGWMF